MTDPELTSHQPGEATPQETLPAATPSASDFGLHDQGWKDDQWRQLLEGLIESKMASWKDICALVLGHLNPSQVGTSLASSTGFKRKYGKGNTMKIVMEWVYGQTGQCADCGTRLELQADHIRGREGFTDPLDADYIENMTLRCRRCNVIKRESHQFGGLTYLTTEAALMWILLVIKPRTFRDFLRMCRIYGMTMADIRMQEAWAMAHWLARAEPPLYGIEDDNNGFYDLILWQDGSITRVDPDHEIGPNSQRIYSKLSGRSIFGFITKLDDGRLRHHEQPISFIPFSTYDLDDRPKNSLTISYVPPDRENNQRGGLGVLSPKGMTMILNGVRQPNELFELVSTSELAPSSVVLSPAPTYGKLIKTKITADAGRLQVVDRPIQTDSVV